MYKESILPEEIEKLPLGQFPGSIHVINKEGKDFSDAIQYLKRQELIGFDTETRPVFSPNQPHRGVALLQLSGEDRAFLFRVQLLGIPKPLADVMASRKILKIGAASTDDVRGLQKVAGFEAHAFVDLQKIAWQWGIRDKSVKKLAANILGCRISKAQQLSNWEADKLSVSQQMYAATDAWVCREMYLKLIATAMNPLRAEVK